MSYYTVGLCYLDLILDEQKLISKDITAPAPEIKMQEVLAIKPV